MKNFVICHDALLVSRASKSLSGLGADTTWVMVGDKDFGDLVNDPDVIVARFLPDNIEHRKELCSFTAWYALVKNGFIEDDVFYGLFEYDIKVCSNFVERVLPTLSKNRVIGFERSQVYSFLFANRQVVNFVSGFMDLYGIDVFDVVGKELDLGRILWCPSTNVVISGFNLKCFVNWIMPFFDTVGYDKSNAFIPERALRIWMALYNINPILVKGVLKHFMSVSHDISWDVKIQ